LGKRHFERVLAGFSDQLDAEIAAVRYARHGAVPATEPNHRADFRAPDIPWQKHTFKLTVTATGDYLGVMKQPVCRR
jgi:hypothetical protein